MTKLKLGPIADSRPAKVTLELPASLHRDLKERNVWHAAGGGLGPGGVGGIGSGQVLKQNRSSGAIVPGPPR